jgi:hypothetical protein
MDRGIRLVHGGPWPLSAKEFTGAWLSGRSEAWRLAAIEGKGRGRYANLHHGLSWAAGSVNRAGDEAKRRWHFGDWWQQDGSKGEGSFW